jgi:acetylornithine deacetylase
MIYGRGAVDMKGGIASMVMAAEAVRRSGVKLAGDVLVGTVVDEETGGMGTLALVARGYRADACIVTEATDLKIAPLCRGILWGKLTLQGRSGHIELPQPHWTAGGAVDAIQKAHLYLDQFERFNQDWALRKRHPLLARPCQVFIAQIRAGEYPSTFANQAELMFNAQFLPAEKDAFGLGSKVKKEIEDFVAAVAATDSWLRQNPPAIQWLVDADCGETPADHEFVRLCAKVMEELGTPAAVEGLGFHTDMGWFVDVGMPTINFGAGNVNVAHQNDEAIGEAELVQATRIMASILLDWCGVAD